MQRIADAWAELMAQLGYDRFGAAGGDWGTTISTCLGQQHPDRIAGIHLAPPLAPPDPATFGDLTGRERSALDALRHGAEWDSGYSVEQGTRPQTIGYALTDSPAALAAWIMEKFWAWTDHDGDLEAVVPRDRLLDNLMLYWLPRTGASAARLYWESIRDVRTWISGDVTDTVAVPAGCAVFPKELQRPLAALGRAPLHRHPALERAAARRPLRGAGAARDVRGGAARLLPARALIRRAPACGQTPSMESNADEDQAERAEAAPAADPREDVDEGPEGRHEGGQPQAEREREAREDD